MPSRRRARASSAWALLLTTLMLLPLPMGALAQAPAPTGAGGAPDRARGADAPLEPAPAGTGIPGEEGERDLAAEPEGLSPAREPTEASEGLAWTLLKMVMVLGGVLALVYLTLNFGMRRLLGIKPPGVEEDALVSVLQRVPLDTRRALFVIKAGGEYLLVGGGESTLSLISKLDAEEVRRLAQRPGRPAASPFLQKLLAGRRGQPPPTV